MAFVGFLAGAALGGLAGYTLGSWGWPGYYGYGYPYYGYGYPNYGYGSWYGYW